MKLFDTHCHINAAQFTEDVDAVIERAQENNVDYMLVVGCDEAGIYKTLELIEKYKGLYGSVAWHPVDAIDFNDKMADLLETAWKHPKVKAIGETGLDYHWDKSPKELQKELFMWHLTKAHEYQMPFTIHNREAHGDVLDILQQYAKKNHLNGVMHSFSGSIELAYQFLALDLYLSISGVVTFKNAKNVKEVVEKVPLHRLLIETDAPYLTPEPYRGKRNEPSYVRYVAQTIADLKNIDLEELANQTTENAMRVFSIE